MQMISLGNMRFFDDFFFSTDYRSFVAIFAKHESRAMGGEQNKTKQNKSPKKETCSCNSENFIVTFNWYARARVASITLSSKNSKSGDSFI